MQNAELPIYLIALGNGFQGFEMPDIKYTEGTVGVVPAFGCEDDARLAVAGLSRVSGVLKSQFRICKYQLVDVLEG